MGEFKSKAEQAIQAGEQFCELYYDIYDNKRHLNHKLNQGWYHPFLGCKEPKLSYGLQHTDNNSSNNVSYTHQLAKLFTTSSVQIWNGNSSTGETKIVEFITNLPSSEHVIHSLDCQPVLEIVTPGQITILVTVEGSVSYGGKRPEYFNQNFMLTSIDNIWKIATDCFRYVDR